MEETCRGNRTIVIVDLLPPGVMRAGQFTHNLCRQTEAESRIEPTYEIIYIPVPFPESISNHMSIEGTKNSTPCNGLIIYARTQGNAEVLKAMESNIIQFCVNVKNFKNTVIFIDSDNQIVNNIPEYLNHYNVTGVTCLNIQVRDDGFIKTYLYGNDILLFVPEHIYRQPAVSLVCSWWFEYYVGKIFSCGTGRLVQYSGTCYLNAAVNGIILSENVSSMVLMYMNMAIEADRTRKLKGLIQQGVQIECPRSFKEVLFLYRIMYSVYCSDVRGDNALHRRALPRDIVGHSTDYLLSGNQWYGITPQPAIAPSEIHKGNGGQAFYVLYQMFSSMGVKFVVKYNDRFLMPQLYNLRMSDPQDPEGRRVNLDEFLKFIDKLQPPLNSYVRACDIILDVIPRQDNRIEMTITVPEDRDFYKHVSLAPPEDFGEDFLMDEPDPEEPLEYYEDPEEPLEYDEEYHEALEALEEPEEPLEYDGDPEEPLEGPQYFDLQFGGISLHGPSGGHEIVGYFCNGKPQTYDSANNKINFSNWTDLNNPEVKTGILQDASSYFLTAYFTEAYIFPCVYLNRNKITDYTKLGKCPV